MKPKASEILRIFGDNLSGYWIGNSQAVLDKDNCFQTKKEAQDLIDQWDKVEQYKEKLNIQYDALTLYKNENEKLKEQMKRLMDAAEIYIESGFDDKFQNVYDELKQLEQ